MLAGLVTSPGKSSPASRHCSLPPLGSIFPLPGSLSSLRTATAMNMPWMKRLQNSKGTGSSSLSPIQNSMFRTCTPAWRYSPPPVTIAVCENLGYRMNGSRPELKNPRHSRNRGSISSSSGISKKRLAGVVTSLWRDKAFPAGSDNE